MIADRRPVEASVVHRLARSVRGTPAALGLIAVMALLGSCTSHTATGLRDLSAARLPPLPAQGFLNDTGQGVVLYGLDGRPIGRLPGFSLKQPSSIGEDALALTADRDALFLWDQRARTYVFDAAARVVRSAASLQVRLSGGAVLRSQHSSTPYEHSLLSVLRDGREIVSARDSLDLDIVQERFVEAKGSVLDLVTGRHWATTGSGSSRPACTPAGLRDEDLVVACTVTSDNIVVGAQLSLLASDGTFTALGPESPTDLAADVALVSPDGHFVAIEFGIGCSTSYTAILPIGSNLGHVVSGEQLSALRPTSTKPPLMSRLIGWTADGRAIADIYPPNPCDAPRTDIITYTIDPSTMDKSPITPSGEFWGVRH